MLERHLEVIVHRQDRMYRWLFRYGRTEIEAHDQSFLPDKLTDNDCVDQGRVRIVEELSYSRGCFCGILTLYGGSLTIVYLLEAEM